MMRQAARVDTVVTASTDERTPQPVGIELNSLRQSLQDLKTRDDDGTDEDWETMYDSCDDV